MIHKIINILLIPFKVKYIKRNFSKIFKPHYYVYINIGTILYPIWYKHPYRFAESFKSIYVTYKDTINYYCFIEDRPSNNINYDTVDFHEQLMK